MIGPRACNRFEFKRRPLYAALTVRDLRIENCLYLQLANPIADGQQVEVKNPTGSLWPSSIGFSATATPLRFSPAIHVNQEGYVPSFPVSSSVRLLTSAATRAMKEPAQRRRCPSPLCPRIKLRYDGQVSAKKGTLLRIELVLDLINMTIMSQARTRKRQGE